MVETHPTNYCHYSKRLKITQDESEVANVLLDLPHLITKTLSTRNLPYNWVNKKRRSVLLAPTPPPPPPPPPPPLPPLLRRVKHPAPQPLKVEASSPNTPLSFSPSESDYSKSTNKRKAPPLYSKKMELEEAIKERMETQKQFKKSIELVRNHLKKLVAENLELKAKKKLLTNRGEKEEITASTTQTSVNNQIHAVASTSTKYHHQPPLIPYIHHFNGVNDWVHAGPSTSTQLHHQQPLVYYQHHHQLGNDPVREGVPSSTQLHCLQPLISDQQQQQQYGLVMNQADEEKVYQIDLNVDPEEYAIYRAQTAAARQRRLHVNKGKKIRV